MKDKRNKNKQAPDDDKIHISKNIFEASKEMKQKAAEEARLKEEERERILAERKKKAQEAHEKKLSEERLELMRLKQGIIEESETLCEEKEEEIKLTPWKKIVNFFYHSKWWLGFGTALAAIAIFLIINAASTPHPDIVVLVIGENYALGNESTLKNYIESFSEDFNGNGEVLASVYYIPYTGNSQKDYTAGVPSKLTAELQSSDSVIVIGNKLTEDMFYQEDDLTNLEKLYPEYANIKKDRLMLSQTDFAEKIGIDKSKISDDWYIAIRAPKKLRYSKKKDMQKVYDKDFPVFDAIIKDLSE